MPGVDQLLRLLENLLAGACAATAHDLSRIVAHGDERMDVVRRVNDAGQPGPVVISGPDNNLGMTFQSLPWRNSSFPSQ